MARNDLKMHHIERALMTSLVVLFFVDNVMTMLESTHLTFQSLVRDGLTCDRGNFSTTVGLTSKSGSGLGRAV